MSTRKKSTSTTESSSGSTSDSSSSSGSTSGSDSNSSSSDSESSSSQEPNRRSSSASNNAQQTDGKTAATTKKPPPRRISEAKSQTKGENTEKLSTSAVNKGKAIAAVAKSQQQRSARPPTTYSSDDESTPAKSHPLNQAGKKPANDLKKKPPTQTKPKTAPVNVAPAAAAGGAATGAPPPPPSTGGKAPPAVVKQQQQQLHGLTKAIANKGNLNTKTNVKSVPLTNASKAPPVDSKKKSIFSPDNSTESEDDENTKKIVKSNATKAKTPLQKGKGRPPNRPKIQEKNTTKSSAESSGSSSQTETTTTSDTESESSIDSVPNIKTSANKKVPNKTPPSATKSESKDNGNSESDIENKPAQNVMRKLTRSSSTRKSKHLTAIFNPGKASETESESESKRSLSKSPVKRAPGTKGKSKNSKTNIKNNASSPIKKTTTQPEERRCPVDGCDSNGHLGGHLEKHFTQEACPFYHNMTLADTKAWALERAQRQEERKKALILYEPSKKSTTVEQKAYQLKVKDIRSKFKPNPPSPSRAHALHVANLNKDREPNLTGLVSDYDLQLFREAQALASEKIEEEVKDIPIGKGTKYILMGRHTMEVWYQSPYPDDAARLPKLYLCEFCLRYQKSEVGMKRHAAKCVWRHPPGDEIYRKGKLGVWQVDGKRHKQYCQHLCLLAKFFLDHKTLYYDVEPFLFYVMTLADSEGCHTVGYFSKEKNSFLNYNVSCILTLPPYQRKGFGRLLIDFSYLLTRVEGKIGSPEKPLSDLGLISYRSYWKDVLLDYLCSRTGTTLSIKDVSQEMAINSYDIVSTLQALGMMKYWKGKHIILKKQDVLEEYAERVKSRGTVLKIDPTCLRWTPFVPPAPPGPS